MICESCNKFEATVTYTHVVENKKTTVHLCNFCASKEEETAEPAEVSKPPAPSPGAKIVIELTQTTQADGLSGSVCPDCAMTYDEFKKVGRFGCHGCYGAFSEQLDRLLKRIHGSSRHRGKGLIEKGKVKPTVDEISELRQQLEAAVSEEAFERAAELRDRIMKLDQATAKE